jgi:benzodiazapine receptor
MAPEFDRARAERREAATPAGSARRGTRGAAGARSRAQTVRCAAIAATAVLVAFCIESIMVSADMRRYGALSKPSFTPPIWLAIPVWTAVMVLLAWAFFRVLCRPDYLPDRPGAIRSFLIMLAVSVVWCWAYFVGRHPTLGLATAALTAATAGLAAWRFAVIDRKAGFLLIPGFVAILFAMLIELSISVRNG